MHIKPIVKHIILYTLVHLGLLLSNGIFWDDWSIINVSEETLKDQFINNGVILGYYFHYPFWLLKSPWLYHAVTFVMYGVAYSFVGRILRSPMFNWRPQNAWTMVYLLDVLPFNESKITAICSFYTVCLFLFIIGFYLVHCRNDIYSKFFGVVLFLWAFLTPSIPFYYIGILIMVSVVKAYDKSIVHWIRNTFAFGIKQYGIPIILSATYFVIYKINAQPSAVSQAGYNQIKTDHIGLIPLNIFKTTYINGIEFYQQITKLFNENFGIFIVMLIVMSLLLIKNRIEIEGKNRFAILASGIFLWCIAMVPYLSVGKLPTFYEHLCRHHLLTPFGFCLIIIGIFALIQPKVQSVFLIILMAFFATMTVRQYLNYQTEYIKMTWLKEELKKMSALKDKTTVIMQDQSMNFYSNENPNRYYSWAGLLHSISGKQNMFMGNLEELEYVNSHPEKYCLPEFNMKDYLPKPIKDFTISIYDQPISTRMIIYTWVLNRSEVVKVGASYLKVQGR